MLEAIVADEADAEPATKGEQSKAGEDDEGVALLNALKDASEETGVWLRGANPGGLIFVV